MPTGAGRYRIEHLMVLLLVLLGTLLMLRSETIESISRDLFDWMQAPLARPALDQVAVVRFDWRLENPARKRIQYAELIDLLAGAGVAALVLDAPLSDPARDDPASDRRLESAIVAAGNVFLPVRIARPGSTAPLQEIVPYAPFVRAAAGLGHADLAIDPDGVVRGLYLRAGVGEAWWPHQSLAVAEFLHPDTLAAYPAREPEAGAGPEVRQYYRMLSFAAMPSLMVVSAESLLRGEMDPTSLAGRVVFVGDGRLASTPIGLARSEPAPLPEALALVYAHLRADGLVTPLAEQLVWLLSLLLALLTPLLLPRVSPRRALLLVAGMLLLVLAVGIVLLSAARLWLPLGAPLGAVLLAYPLWSWRRLEYSLAYLRSTVDGMADTDGLSRRLLSPTVVQDMTGMLEHVLPVTAWRLVRFPEQVVTSGGERLPAHAWQGRRAAHYDFSMLGQRYELVLVWDEETPSPALQSWARAMVARCAVSDASERGGDVMDRYIARVREQTEQEQALKAFFESTLASLRDGVLIADACGRLLYLNRRAADWLHLDVNARPAPQLLQLADRLRVQSTSQDWAGILRCAMREGRCRVEAQLVGGAELYLDVQRTAAGVLPGEVLIITLRDVSDLKQALRGRSEVADLLSHDLRSPLLSVLALCETRRQAPLNADEKAFADQIDASTRRGLDIADQFLMLLRAESLTARQMSFVDMLAVTEEAIESLRVAAREAGQRLLLEYQASEEIWVNGHSELLEKALVNLLRDALKRAGEGGRVRATLRRDGRRVLCRVEDNGPGLSARACAALMDRQGLDVRLRLVFAVCDRHGGTLDIDPLAGAGTAFTLSVPAVEPESV